MTKKIFIIAGEASGDLLGAALMQDLKRIVDQPLAFSGIGGPQMIAQGMETLFPLSDLSVIGLAEVVKHLPLLLRRYRQTVTAILAQNPDVLITVDAPDFCLRVARKIKRRRPHIKIIHYVAPTVWAWRPGRAKKIARFLDGLLCLFPFEPPFFTRHGLKAEFVGHPLAKLIPDITDAEKESFLHAHGLTKDAPVLCVLPGSRLREIEAFGPVLNEAITQLKKAVPHVQVIIPALPHLAPHLKNLIHDAHVFVPQTSQEKYAGFAASAAAMQKSGTVALELALCGTPMVTFYKVSTFSAMIAKRLLTTRYANLVNILLDRAVVPELIQEQMTAEILAHMTEALLTQPQLAQMQQEDFALVRGMLEAKPANTAALFIQKFL